MIPGPLGAPGGDARARTGRAAPLPPDERRRAILRAVLPVVRLRGADVTTRELAEAAGVAEGTLFRVFDDKASLVREAVGSAVDPSDLFELIDAMDLSTPLEDRLAVLVSAWLRRMQDVMLWMTLLHQLRKDAAEAHDGGPQGHQEWARRQGEFAAGFRMRLQRLLEADAGRLGQPVPVAAGLLEIALIGAAAQTAGAARTGQQAEPLPESALVELVLHGILTCPGRTGPQPPGPDLGADLGADLGPELGPDQNPGRAQHHPAPPERHSPHPGSPAC